MSRSQLSHEPIERRLRDALEARANAVDLHDLRPAALPTGPGRPLLTTPRTIVALLGLAAAIAAVLLVLTARHPGVPVNPTRTPSISRSLSPSTSAPARPASPAQPPLPASPANPIRPESPVTATVPVRATGSRAATAGGSPVTTLTPSSVTAGPPVPSRG
jgi:hypothetical protein